MKRVIVICVVVAALGSAGAYAQAAVYGLSVGGGFGDLNESFTMSGQSASLVYAAPAGYIDFEVDWGSFYLDMGLGVLVMPVTATLGGTPLNLNGYEVNIGLDFTAMGIGYLFPLGNGLSAGGAVGFHVSAPMLTPPNDDPTMLALEGSYGLIGINLVPRVRYELSKSFVITLSVPVGFDFSRMSDEVVLVGGIDTGATSPAIVRPATLVPGFNGFSVGVYLTVGYLF